MKLGFITSLLDTFTFEQVVDAASEMGYACIEAACWPGGGAERRYAGTCHIDVERVLADEGYGAYLLSYCRQRGVEISSLAYYPNNLASDLEKRAANHAHLEKVIRASAKLGVGMVTTFIGRDQYKTVEENLELVTEIWPPILRLARDLGVRVCIENCPMLFGAEQWPGGENLMTSPKLWQQILDILDFDNLGINYDPSHFVWQMIDYVKPVYQFRDKIWHVHFKDIKLFPDKLDQVGILAYPLEYMEPKLPGLGDINWGSYVAALTDIGFDGYACVEVEDRAFEGSDEDKLKALKLSRRYLEQFVI